MSYVNLSEHWPQSSTVDHLDSEINLLTGVCKENEISESLRTLDKRCAGAVAYPPSEESSELELQSDDEWQKERMYDKG